MHTAYLINSENESVIRAIVQREPPELSVFRATTMANTIIQYGAKWKPAPESKKIQKFENGEPRQIEYLLKLTAPFPFQKIKHKNAVVPPKQLMLVDLGTDKQGVKTWVIYQDVEVLKVGLYDPEMYAGAYWELGAYKRVQVKSYRKMYRGPMYNSVRSICKKEKGSGKNE